MKAVSVIGKYNEITGTADGQVVKTRVLTNELEKEFGFENIDCIDTFGWRKHPIKLLGKCIRAVRKSANVVFMTDAGGIKIFPWLLHCSNIFGSCSLHYVVVGGWLVHFVKKHPFIKLCLKKFCGIYVETTVMKQELEQQGFKNVILMPNFKPLDIVTPDQFPNQYREPFRFCTFSRIMREKGIDNAVAAVSAVNAYWERTICTLDIYGQVDPNQKEWFNELEETFPSEIRYCGVIEYSRSVEVVKDYFALLFPTEFATEGIPGTIIDAYAAGVPVVASRWESYSDVVKEGKTGIGYSFGHPEEMTEILLDITMHPEKIYDMKKHCLKEAGKYQPEQVIDILLRNLT